MQKRYEGDIKVMKKLIALVLCFAMLLSMAVYTFAESKGTINYVSLGSSQTLGYGLPGYIGEKFVKWTGSVEDFEDWNAHGWDAGVWNSYLNCFGSEAELGYNSFGFEVVVPGAVSTLIRDAIKKQGYDVNFSQLAFAGSRANDLLAFLYDDYVPDAYHQYYCYNEGMFFWRSQETPEKCLEYLKKKYQSAIKEADFITYDLGAGNFGCQMQSFYGDDNWEEVYKNSLSTEEYILFSKLRTLIKTGIEELLQKNDIDPASVSYLNEIDRYTYCLLGFCTSFDKAMDWIYTNNPDVCVVVSQIQNFAPSSLYYIEGLEIYATDLVDILVGIANSYTASMSKYADKYYYARITDDSRVRIICDDIVDYEGPEDLNEVLKQAVDNYLYYEGEPTPKLMFTVAYGAAGKKVHDEDYDDALTNAYDTFFKFMKYVATTDYSIVRISDDSTLKNILSQLISESYADYSVGLSNEAALSDAIESFESLSIEEKRQFKYFFINYNDAVLHPNYEGQQQMADAIINALEMDERGMTSILKGVKNGFKDFIKSNGNVGKFVANKVVADIQENVKTKVNKAIGIVVKAIKAFSR